MNRRPTYRISSGIAIVFSAMLSASVLGTNAGASIAQERPVPAEKNPPGDIPDSQVFVRYSSPSGFSLEVPEGWPRTEQHNAVRFADKFNTIEVNVAPAAAAPTVASTKARQPEELIQTGQAVRIIAVNDVKLPVGPAIEVVYQSNSARHPLTNKQLRQENKRYLIFRHGKLAALDLAAPLGADNADQWHRIANSFRWN
jgi:hypothetical protein